MGGIYKSTSHLYFCHVIKKKIKKHYLVYDLVKKWEDSGLLDDITGLIPDTNIFPMYNDFLTFLKDNVGTVDGVLINQYPT